MEDLDFSFIDNAINGLDTSVPNYGADFVNQMQNDWNEQLQYANDQAMYGGDTAMSRKIDRQIQNNNIDALMKLQGMSKEDAELLAKPIERVASDNSKGGSFDFKIGDKPEGGWANATMSERHEALEKTGMNLRELPKDSKEYAENTADILDYLDSSRTKIGVADDYYKFMGEDNPNKGAGPLGNLRRTIQVGKNREKIKDAAMVAANNIINGNNVDVANTLANRLTDKQKSELDINKSLKDILKKENSRTLNVSTVLELVADPVSGQFIDKENTDAIVKAFANPNSEAYAKNLLNLLKGDDVSDLAKTLRASIESVSNEKGWNVGSSTEEKPSSKAADSIAETYDRKKLSEYYDPKGSGLTDEEVKGMAKTLGKQFIANLKEGRVRDTWDDFVKGNARAATKVLNTLDDFWKHPLKNLKTIVNEVKNTNLLSLILGTALGGLDYSTTEETEDEDKEDENLEGSGGATGDVEVVIEDILDKIATGELDEGNVTTYINSLSEDGTVSDKDKGLFTVEKNVSKDENKYNKGLKETPSDEEIKTFFKPAVLRLMASRL